MALLQQLFHASINYLPDSLRFRLVSEIVNSMSYKEKLILGVPNMFASLMNMHHQGFRPKTVIDVGAYRGEWSREVGKIFPQASFHLFEPQPDKAPFLEDLAGTASHPISIHKMLLGAASRDDVPFQLLEMGSSVLPEKTSFPRTTVTMAMRTLDDSIDSISSAGPILLKLDVQGYELEVLKGATEVLCHTDAILLEVALLEYNEGSPLLADVVAFLRSRNFVVYDVCSVMRRQTDNAVFQTDLLFVRMDHPLRHEKKFWLHEP